MLNLLSMADVEKKFSILTILIFLRSVCIVILKNKILPNQVTFDVIFLVLDQDAGMKCLQEWS